MESIIDLAPHMPSLGLDPLVRESHGWRAPTGRGEMLRLDLNENRFVTREKLTSLLASIEPEQLTMYPEYAATYRVLSRYTGRSESELLLSNGADQAIELALRTFCPRRRLVLPVPTFSYYQHVAALLGVELAKVPYDTSFGLSADAVCAALREGADGVVLVTPSNPLGTALEPAVVLSIAMEARRRGAFVLIDEVYCEFHGASFEWLLDSFDNVLLVRSFSKGFGLAGLRLGYLLTAPQNVRQLEKVRGPWDVSALAAGLATTALERADWLDFLPTLVAERALLCTCLSESGFRVAQSRTNFLVARHPHARLIAAWLARQGVLVADLDGYPDGAGLLQHCLRIGVPNPAERDEVHALLRSAPSACHEGVS